MVAPEDQRADRRQLPGLMKQRIANPLLGAIERLPARACLGRCSERQSTRPDTPRPSLATTRIVTPQQSQTVRPPERVLVLRVAKRDPVVAPIQSREGARNPIDVDLAWPPGVGARHIQEFTLDRILLAGCVLEGGIVSRSLPQHQHRPEGVVNTDPGVLVVSPQHHSDHDRTRGMGAGFSVCQRQVVGSAIT